MAPWIQSDKSSRQLFELSWSLNCPVSNCLELARVHGSSINDFICLNQNVYLVKLVLPNCGVTRLTRFFTSLSWFESLPPSMRDELFYLQTNHLSPCTALIQQNPNTQPLKCFNQVTILSCSRCQVWQHFTSRGFSLVASRVPVRPGDAIFARLKVVELLLLESTQFGPSA